MARVLVFRRSGLAALGGALMLLTPLAVAELFCSDPDAIVAGLTNNFHER